MYEAGISLLPGSNGAPWFEKPVLMYWGAASATRYSAWGIRRTFPFGRCSDRFASSSSIFADADCGTVRRSDCGTGIGLLDRIFYVCPCRIDGHAADGVSDNGAVFISGGATTTEGNHAGAGSALFTRLLDLGHWQRVRSRLCFPGASSVRISAFRRRLGEWKTCHPGCAWITAAIAAPVVYRLYAGSTVPRSHVNFF